MMYAIRPLPGYHARPQVNVSEQLTLVLSGKIFSFINTHQHRWIPGRAW